MQDNKNYRTLYMIQVLTIVVLVLVLIMQVLPLFGIGPNAPHFYTKPGAPGAPGGGGYTSPSIPHTGMHTTATDRQAALLIPPLTLR
ncbi:MAG TPA: hypothetical protein VKV37_22790 [Ktedonobacteraceae bacterium]|jgi:hypothetical protein|nr:hypothetical protein [Ktedonobacteraceae bacterium]